MPSVIIAAHNEAFVIGRCLDAVLADARPGEFEVIVAANGCTDDTAAIARSRAGVRVLETDRPGKARALNQANDVATGWPRVYLDADIPATTETVRALCDSVAPRGPALVAVPGRRLEVTGRPLLVRAYFAIQRHLPCFEDGLFGRGLIVVSQRGGERCRVFPEVMADDLFLDSLFGPDERVTVGSVATTVATPLRTRDLVQRLVRVRRGNTALRSQQVAGSDVRPAARWSWWHDVVVRRPWLAPAAAVYVALTGWAALQARRDRDSTTWGRDDSSRTPAGVGVGRGASG